MYTVYCHIFPNGKRYIGLTGMSVNRRWGNGDKYKTCPLINRAISKYGWENITHEILADGLSCEDAKRLEREYIAVLQTTDLDKGYNILSGGDVADGITEQIRYKLGNGMRGRRHSEETKLRISASLRGTRKGIKHPLYGTKASRETKIAMSHSHRKRWENPELRKQQSKTQRLVWSDPEYRDKMSRSRIGRQSGNLGKAMSEDAKRKIGEANIGKWLGEKSPTAKPILQKQKDGKIVRRWACAGEAQRELGIDRSNIAACCRGKTKSAGGYVWAYEQI